MVQRWRGWVCALTRRRHASAREPVLAGLARSYVDALNRGGAPVISTAWQVVLAVEVERAGAATVELYRIRCACRGLRSSALAFAPRGRMLARESER